MNDAPDASRTRSESPGVPTARQGHNGHVTTANDPPESTVLMPSPVSGLSVDQPRSVIAELRTWPARRWWVALGTAILTLLLVAMPTALIPTPWFGREIPPTPWAWPVLVATSVLAGLVAATYVARKDVRGSERGGVLGSAGAVVSLFAVGCPVCNKLVLLALGYAGALQYFEPVQPYLALLSIVLLVVALVVRIRRERSCPVPSARPDTSVSESQSALAHADR